MQSGSVALSGAEIPADGLPETTGTRMMSYVTGFMEQRASGDRSFKIWAAGARLLPKIWRVRGLDQSSKIAPEDMVSESESRISEERSQLGREIREALLGLG